MMTKLQLRGSLNPGLLIPLNLSPQPREIKRQTLVILQSCSQPGLAGANELDLVNQILSE